jgi:hypothetical protein
MLAISWFDGFNQISIIFDNGRFNRQKDESLRSPLKVSIIPTFRGIVVQVRIFRLEMPFLPFSAEIFSLKRHFCHLQLFSTFPFFLKKELDIFFLNL